MRGQFEHVQIALSMLAYKICVMTLYPPLCKACSGASMRYIAGAAGENLSNLRGAEHPREAIGSICAGRVAAIDFEISAEGLNFGFYSCRPISG